MEGNVCATCGLIKEQDTASMGTQMFETKDTPGELGILTIETAKSHEWAGPITKK